MTIRGLARVDPACYLSYKKLCMCDKTWFESGVWGPQGSSWHFYLFIFSGHGTTSGLFNIQSTGIASTFSMQFQKL